MPYILITDTAKKALNELSLKRKADDSLIKTKVDVASEAIINATESECNIDILLELMEPEK